MTGKYRIRLDAGNPSQLLGLHLISRTTIYFFSPSKNNVTGESHKIDLIKLVNRYLQII